MLIWLLNPYLLACYDKKCCARFNRNLPIVDAKLSKFTLIFMPSINNPNMDTITKKIVSGLSSRLVWCAAISVGYRQLSLTYWLSFVFWQGQAFYHDWGGGGGVWTHSQVCSPELNAKLAAARKDVLAVKWRIPMGSSRCSFLLACVNLRRV